MKKIVWAAVLVMIAMALLYGQGKDAVVSMASSDIYYCPMHPSYTSNKPGTCPICGMDLVRKKNASSSSEAQDQAVPLSGIPGHAAVSIDEAKQQLIGVRTFQVVRKSLDKPIHAVGRVVHDLELYEAKLEYISAWQDYRLLRARRIVKDEFRDVHLRFLKAEYELLHMGISSEELKEFRQLNFAKAFSDRPWIYGEIFQKPLNAKDLPLFHEQDASFVYAEVFESDLHFINIGQPAILEMPDLEKKLEGVVRGISSKVEPETRTVRVRVELAEHAPDLKANMYVKVLFLVALDESLVIPKDAVVMTGERTLAYIKKGDGVFVPKEIETGEESRGFIQVKSGLNDGDTVVSGANFLIDSESRLHAAFEGSENGTGSGDAPAGGHRHE